MTTKETNPKEAAGDKRIPLALLSPIAKAHWALAQFAGMLKYGAWNWRAAGVRSSTYLSAMQRHIDAYNSGEEHDPVDGSHHLGNIMACAAILLDARQAGKLTDDRPPIVGLRSAYAEVEASMGRLREQYADRAPRHYTISDSEKEWAAPPCPAAAVAELPPPPTPPLPFLERRKPRPQDAELLELAAQALNDFGVNLQGDDAPEMAALYKTWTPERCWELKAKLRAAAREGRE